MDEKKTAAFHSLMLERQKGGTITGIREVISFDEKEILLHTEEGKLSIKGEGLHVKHLDLKSYMAVLHSYYYYSMRNKLLIKKIKNKM